MKQKLNSDFKINKLSYKIMVLITLTFLTRGLLTTQQFVMTYSLLPTITFSLLLTVSYNQE